MGLIATPRALLRAALVTGKLPSLARRVHHTARLYGPSDPGGAGLGDNKPGEQSSSTSQDVDSSAESSSGTETSSGHARGQTGTSWKTRQARKNATFALPPVELPARFLEECVTIYDEKTQPRLPPALVEDSNRRKSPRPGKPAGFNENPLCQFYDMYFGLALDIVMLRSHSLAEELRRWEDNEMDAARFDLLRHTERVLRLTEMMIDAMWHIVDNISLQKRPEDMRQIRPFWWYHLQEHLRHMLGDYDELTKDPAEAIKDSTAPLYNSLCDLIYYSERLDQPMAHATVDIPVRTIVGLQSTLDHQLQATPPPSFHHRRGKRPMTILSLLGYGGKGVSEALAERLAYIGQADLVRLNAARLSVLLGEYLGQDWAYARGVVSTLGFRVAELNGKLWKEPQLPRRTDDEDDRDDIGVISFRNSISGAVEEELQKCKQGSYDIFSKLDSLKIDKFLDHIVRSPSLKKPSSESRPVIIHVHDVVELSMTPEGSLILAKLRTLVDAAWEDGAKIALFGTSSCELPTDEYLNAARQLSAVDLVVTRNICPNSGDDAFRGGEKDIRLQSMDYFFENIENIDMMLGCMDPELAKRPLTLSDRDLENFLHTRHIRFVSLKARILSMPEVYTLASAYRNVERMTPGEGKHAFLMEQLLLHPLRVKPVATANGSPGEPKSDGVDSGNRPNKSGEGSQQPSKKAPTSDHEKRIANCVVDPKRLRTTFADVHVPPDTISALKLLTSLALTRPDAFSYGILAQEKMTGCLLYGPPGTGKTMLAKAVAKESGANMLELSGAIINDKWVGESEKLVRAVFTTAKRLSPCVVFIDEADAMLARRNNMYARISHRDVINQFLKEWDGLEESDTFIMIATNRPFDLDDAVLRRLPRKILVDLPDKSGRAAILRLMLQKELLDANVSIDDLATRTPNYSGSDLKNLCIAAAVIAVDQENQAAARHKGPTRYVHPPQRILRKEFFEQALKQVVPSTNDDMESLRMIRDFDAKYGARHKSAKPKMGFDILLEKQIAPPPNDTSARPGGAP